MVKTPVGKHSHIDSITVGQQDVVSGRTPAGAHIGIAVIAVVHQIAIMTPELVHKDAGSAAGINQCLVISAVVGQFAAHIVDVLFLSVLQHTRGTNTALFLRQAHVVTLQQVDVQMQAGGSANNSIVHIGASAAISTVAIVLG